MNKKNQDKKNIKIGLTLGKFAPLHKGHQLLIETAKEQVDKLIVMIYDAPELLDIPPLPIRKRWLEELYPEITIIEAWNEPTQNGYTPEIMKAHEEYIIKKLSGEKITHFFASEPYVEHVSKALGAKGILVDEKREKIPISATKIREEPYKNKEFLEPRVYKDLITNIVFLGGPSTGKSTITKALAEKYNTQFMPEYGREYWNLHQKNRRLTTKQLVEIAQGHIKKEEKLLEKSNKYLFTDTNAITTYLFSMNYHGKADKKLFELANECHKRYDLVFLCETDIPYENSWDRSGDSNREEMQRRTISFLQENKIPYITLSGNLEERITKVATILNNYKKYQNIAE
jgi:NadR type nicotinamide-nucleotide adenylyltransferase